MPDRSVIVGPRFPLSEAVARAAQGKLLASDFIDEIVVSDRDNPITSHSQIKTGARRLDAM